MKGGRVFLGKERSRKRGKGIGKESRSKIRTNFDDVYIWKCHGPHLWMLKKTKVRKSMALPSATEYHQNKAKCTVHEHSIAGEEHGCLLFCHLRPVRLCQQSWAGDRDPQSLQYQPSSLLLSLPPLLLICYKPCQVDWAFTMKLLLVIMSYMFSNETSHRDLESMKTVFLVNWSLLHCW